MILINKNIPNHLYQKYEYYIMDNIDFAGTGSTTAGRMRRWRRRELALSRKLGLPPNVRWLEKLYWQEFQFVFGHPPSAFEACYLFERDNVVSQIPAHHRYIRTSWLSGKYAEERNMRNEQRYAICAGFWHNHMPNDLTRLVCAYAVPRSKVYAYMK